MDIPYACRLSKEGNSVDDNDDRFQADQAQPLGRVAGHEATKRRPAVVVSSDEFNLRSCS